MFQRIILSILSGFLLSLSAVQAADKVTYEDDIKPILREHCFACHNTDDPTASLALDSFDGLIAGGASGEVVAAGDLDGSRLWKLVTHEEEPTMPPENKMPQPQLDILRAWIQSGLLKDAGSKPMKSNKPAIAKIDAANLGKPVGEPALPEQLFHQPILWAPQVGPVDALATSPWAPVAAIAWQRQVSFYNTNTFQLMGIIPYVEGIPRVVRFSRDGSLVLVAGGRHAAAGSAALFDVKTGARLATLGDELDIVLAADISPDLSLVAIGGPKKKVRVYNIADGSLAYQLGKHTEWITALGFSPNGKLLATADRNGGALLWQAAAGHERADLRGHKGSITSLDWRADSAMLATASDDGTVRLWNPNGQQIKSINAHGGGALSVRFSRDGNWVSAGRDRKVKTWKPDGGAIADLGAMSGMTLAADFSHDGSKIIASDYSGEVRVYDSASKKQVTTLSANPRLLADRLATAEKTMQQAQQTVQTSDNNLKAQLAALEQGKAAHAAHEKKLAAAQQSLTTARKQLEEVAQAHTDHKQKLVTANAQLEQSTATLTAAQNSFKQAQEETVQQTEDSENADEEGQQESNNSDQVAALQKQVDEALAAQTTSQQAAQQAEQNLKAVTEKQTAATTRVKAAEATLAKVTNETAGLPDLAKLTQQHDQTQAALLVAQKAHEQAHAGHALVAAQQARFTEATKFFANELQESESQKEELGKQSESLAGKHLQAANQLQQHRRELSKLAEQLKALQSKYNELEANGSTLQEQESKLAEQLGKIQAALTEAKQKAEQINASQRDFAAAAKLRAEYAK